MAAFLTEQDLHIVWVQGKTDPFRHINQKAHGQTQRQRLFSQTRSISLWAAATEVVTGHLWQHNPLLGHALMNYAASIIFWTSRMWQIHQISHSLSLLFNSIRQIQGCRIMCFSACPAPHTTSNSWRLFRSHKKSDILHSTVTRWETSFTLPSKQCLPVELQLDAVVG